MIRRFFGRFLCLFFGHKPLPITFLFDDKSSKLGDLVVMRPAPNAGPILFNLCGRCDELARHAVREPIVAQGIMEFEAGQAAQAKAQAEAKANQRQPGESLKRFKARTGAGSGPRAVPDLPPTPEAENKP